MGTCFVIDVDKRQYFVTAKHVVDGLQTGNIIHLFARKTWIPVLVQLIGHSNEGDISVFSIPQNEFARFPLPTGSGGLMLGQDVYFLGFPYGLSSEVGALNHDAPLPLVKKAIISSLQPIGNLKIFLLDGHNNIGFSGGPVVFKPMKRNDFAVCSVISGYKYEIVNAKLNNSTTPLEIKTNTGIIISYDIIYALDLIRANPNGTVIAH